MFRIAVLGIVLMLSGCSATATELHPKAMIQLPASTQVLDARAQFNQQHQLTRSIVRLALPAKQSVTTVTVKSKDTLFRLAAKLKLSWQGLYCANRRTIGNNPDLILIGQRLTVASIRCQIPRPKTILVAASSTPAATTTPPPTAALSGSWQDIVASMEDPASAACTDAIIERESGGRVDATNPSSGAYGIPQALPGSKMASAGADWATSAVTQIRWMIGYMRNSYGSACGAWSFWQAHGAY